MGIHKGRVKDLSKGDKMQEFWSEYGSVGEENEGIKRGGRGLHKFGGTRVEGFGSL